MIVLMYEWRFCRVKVIFISCVVLICMMGYWRLNRGESLMNDEYLVSLIFWVVNGKIS